MTKEEQALLKAMYMAILQIRMLGYEGQNDGLSKEQSMVVADLADAIHNIPEAIASGEYDLNFQVEIMLKGFAEKYPNYEGLNPYNVYKNTLSGANKR